MHHRMGGADAQLESLPAMLEELNAAPEIVRPSRFWEHYNDRNLEQLRHEGLGEFKQTVNRNYFQWVPGGPRDVQFRAVLRHWLDHPDRGVFGARLTEPLGVPQLPVSGPEAPRSPIKRALRVAHLRVIARAYALYVAMLAEYAARRDVRGLLDRLEEPSLGHPLHVRHRGRLISEDLANSLLEFAAMDEVIRRRGARVDRVVELGSGYGRLAWLFLEALSGVQYVLVDIPPALAIAEEYLTQLFDDRPSFRFRHFDRLEEVADELAAARIVFLTPNQLDLLSPLGADLFINVSSLHEMRIEQIAHYLHLVDRHTGGWFYSKQWMRSVNDYDGIVVEHADYPVPPQWQVEFDRRHPTHPLFFEAMYRVGEAPLG